MVAKISCTSNFAISGINIVCKVDATPPPTHTPGGAPTGLSCLTPQRASTTGAGRGHTCGNSTFSPQRVLHCVHVHTSSMCIASSHTPRAAAPFSHATCACALSLPSHPPRVCRFLEDSGLTGPIPAADLAKMTGLTHLCVRTQTLFSSRVGARGKMMICPAFVLDVSGLVYRHLISPPLPPPPFFLSMLLMSTCSLARVSPSLAVVLLSRFLQNNRLNGTIPREIGLLTNLQFLCVVHATLFHSALSLSLLSHLCTLVLRFPLCRHGCVHLILRFGCGSYKGS